jgi:hypothetical protein
MPEATAHRRVTIAEPHIFPPLPTTHSLPHPYDVSTRIEERTTIIATSSPPVMELCPSISPHSKTAGDKFVVVSERYSAAAQDRATQQYRCRVRLCGEVS